jgi:hypothetical protein
MGEVVQAEPGGGDFGRPRLNPDISPDQPEIQA